MNRSPHFQSLKTDIEQRLSSRVGREVQLVGELPWFELGIMYNEMGLVHYNDEVAADKLVAFIIEQDLI